MGRVLYLFVAVLMLGGCGMDGALAVDPGDGGPVDGSTDLDVDTDSDTDTDTDTDGDTDTGTQTAPDTDSGTEDDTDTPEDTETATGPDTASESDTGSDSDTGIDTGTGPDTDTGPDTAGNCTGPDVWQDPDEFLCWQDPQADALMDWEAAVAYCDALVLDGVDDWTLPDIDQLKSLIEGCDSAGCAVTEVGFGCLDVLCADHPSCDICDPMEGPGAFGCYVAAGLVNWDCEYEGNWSSSEVSDLPNGAWAVTFRHAGFLSENKLIATQVRCVRETS